MANDNKQHYTDFDEYIRQGEPSQKEKTSIWQTAIGLQAVDGLQTSDYLKATACKLIEGEIDIDEARELIKVMGEKNMSVKEMLCAIGLKERKNFLKLYLHPATSDDYVCLLYPDSPRHPRQKYLLTMKGLAVYEECNK